MRSSARVGGHWALATSPPVSSILVTVLRRRVHNSTNFFRELVLRKRLQHELDAGVEPPVVHDRIARITRREQHLETGTAFGRHVGKLSAVDTVRQADIRE